ncbi:GAF domain-containing protein [Granulicella paludicola]|uniref:GAF domain-containing protein n=1 Tax=Granulicella paludicola TaxID=474951 RepID=UPI0021E008BE|nr:GAF domain-containing protein [Granulicella paludicola]
MISPCPHHLDDTGIEANDIRVDSDFSARRLHTRDTEIQIVAMRRLVRAILSDEKSVLQELVDIAVELCGAESAGISLEQPNAPDATFYRWIATNGACNPFLNAQLPRYPSACGVSLERGGPQQFRFYKRFYDLIGITAPEVTDGIVLPWSVDNIRGTLFIMAHSNREAFDIGDCRMMELLAEFAALAIRQRRQQDAFLRQATLSRSAAMADTQASQPTNALKSLVHVLYLAEAGAPPAEFPATESYLSIPSPKPGDELPPLAALVNKLLSMPYPASAPASPSPTRTQRASPVIRAH